MSISVFSVEGLISWLETKPPDQHYTFMRSERCLITLYLRERTGREEPSTLGEIRKWGLESIANAPGKQTYGYALERAKKQLKQIA